jgi:lysophospholipase L1-like esterase
MRIILLGDSTIANYDIGRYPQVGWGQIFPRYIKKEVEVLNFGKGGASSRNFYEEGNFSKAMMYLNKHDYVIIQFGHNDQKSEPERQTDPFTSYQDYLKMMIKEIRRLGGIPILLTSITRRNFNEFGELEKSIHKEFPKAMLDLSVKEKIETLDIYEKTWTSISNLGVNNSRKLFMNLKKDLYPNYPLGLNDNTHLTYEGGIWATEIIVEALKEKNLLTEYFI